MDEGMKGMDEGMYYQYPKMYEDNCMEDVQFFKDPNCRNQIKDWARGRPPVGHQLEGMRRYMPFTCDEAAGFNIIDCDGDRIELGYRGLMGPEFSCDDASRSSMPMNNIYYNMEMDGYSNCISMDGTTFFKFRNPNWMMGGPGGDMSKDYDD